MARPFFRKGFALAFAGSLAVAIMLPARSASAEPSTPTGKGIAGGVLLGAEAVVTVEALLGVDKPWAYAVGGIVGGGLGGVAGYFAEKSGSDPHLPLYMLAGGMAFAVPAAILALNATSYRPPEDYENEKPVQGELPADAPAAQPGPASAPKTSLRWQSRGYYAPMPSFRRIDTAGFAGGGLLQVTDTGMRMGVPAVEVRPLYSVTEVQKFGLGQKEELRVPLFRAVFLAVFPGHRRTRPW